MSAIILDGKLLSTKIRGEIAIEVSNFVNEGNSPPTLAAVLVGEDAASQVYVRNKEKACQAAGINSQLHRLPVETTQQELLRLVEKLNNDSAISGILVQLPLPNQIDEATVLQAISALKDVDGFHPENVGLLVQGRPRFIPCTPCGIQEILARYEIETAGKHAVVLGRSDIVGKPMANLLIQRGAGGDATVTVCHSRTPNLAEVTKSADILIVAIGRANFITADMVKPGAVVIDVGINRLESGLVGDVDFKAVEEIAGYITPVPGGVGRLTVTMLLKNTLTAAMLQNS